MLKCTEQTVISVYYSDLEQFIKEETGQTYDIVCQEEYNNDIHKEFDVDGDTMYLGEVSKWLDFKGGKIQQYMLRTILDGLCRDGKIKSGKYLVHISW
jgi:hypothetical protein